MILIKHINIQIQILTSLEDANMFRKTIATIILILFTTIGYSASLFMPSYTGINNQYGKVNSFGKLYFYESGTTTEKDVYSDNGSTVISQPVSLDGTGRRIIYIDGTYRIIIKDRDLVTIMDTDPVTASSSGGTTITEINDVGDVNISTDQGTISYRDSAGDLVGLAPATSGYVLQTNGVSSNPTWAVKSLAELTDIQDVYVDPSNDPLTASTDDFYSLKYVSNNYYIKKTTLSSLWGVKNSIDSSAATGDIIYFDGTDWDRLPAGTANYVLQANGAAAPSWVTAPSGLPSGTQGDILYYNGSAWVVLGYGTSGQLLKTNGAGSNPSWVTASKPEKMINLVAGSFDYPDGVTYELAPLDYDSGTYNRIYFHRFDDTYPEYLQGTFAVPTDWNNGSVIVEVIGYSTYSTSGNVKFDLYHSPYNSTTALTTNYSATVNSSSATTINSTNYKTTKITITFTPSWADGDDIQFRLRRDPATDTMPGDFKLTSMRVRLGRN